MIAAVALLAITPQPTRASSLTGDIRPLPNFESKILGNKRNILVYLPPDYENSHDRYPVLYLCDGQNCFDGATSFIPNQEWRADETAESLIRAKLVRPIIMVAVDNAGAKRTDEYTPAPIKRLGGGHAAEYEKFLVDELKPYVDRTYRTRTGPANTGLVGSSLGGILTACAGMDYPKVFGKLGIMSPSVWWDDKLLLKLVAQKAKPGQRVYIDIGTHEGDREALLNVHNAELLRDAYKKIGYQEGKDLTLVEDYGAEHNEIAWSRRFPIFLRWIWR